MLAIGEFQHLKLYQNIHNTLSKTFSWQSYLQKQPPSCLGSWVLRTVNPQEKRRDAFSLRLYRTPPPSPKTEMTASHDAVTNK